MGVTTVSGGKGRRYQSRKKALRSKKCSPELTSAAGSKKKCSWEHLSRALLRSTISHTIIISWLRPSPCQSPSNTTTNATVPPPRTDRHRYEDKRHRATTLHRLPPIRRRTSLCKHLENHRHHCHCYHTNVATWKGGARSDQAIIDQFQQRRMVRGDGRPGRGRTLEKEDDDKYQ